MLLGTLQQLLFKPRAAVEKDREVAISLTHTHIGLYLLMLLGTLQQLLFKPRAAVEKDREVAISLTHTHIGLYLLMLLGTLQQLLFKPRAAVEKDREVAISLTHAHRPVPPHAARHAAAAAVKPRAAVEKDREVAISLTHTHIGLYLLMLLGTLQQLLFKPRAAVEKDREVAISLTHTHIGLYLLMLLGTLQQLLFKPRAAVEKDREGYARLYNPFDQFYSRYLYRRVRHCFNRPICSTPGATLVLKERVTKDYNWSFSWSGTTRECINLGSYNYLGFAEPSGPRAQAAAAAARRYGLATCSSRAELGTTPLHQHLEECTAKFLRVESAIVFGMGFATNSLVLPALIGPGALVLSDEKNHASLILGLRLARVKVRVFKHNDIKDVERLARHAIQEGKWTKIVIVVEGVYSMEGSVVPLRALVALKKRLGLQLYLDEAHSIGAMGASGRGVTDHAGVDPKDVDVLMGTFTKSFGAAGGYIAGSEKLVLSAMQAIAGPEGARRIKQLKDNTHYFRNRLHAMGVVVFGHPDSPVVPMLVYTFSKMAATVERLTERGIAVVGVGFPAVPLSKSMIRFCLSAAHTREQLDTCLAAIEDVVDEVGLRYSRKPRQPITEQLQQPPSGEKKER
ncbi:aminotransferase class I and II domain-containing protein [Phthorimaea operculella]|nr:aminotransferase class I and II domain-containing protein [Phthorimaea operculella]